MLSHKCENNREMLAEVREIEKANGMESGEKLPKVTARLTIKKIINGYADCEVRLIAEERTEKQRSSQ